MLKKRIIPILQLLDSSLVKTQQFDTWRNVGDPVKSAGVYNSQYTDELILIDINREKRTIDQLASLIPEIAKVTFMPLAVGGGIKSVEDAACLINQGADKVIINSAAYTSPQVITEIANQFGSQAVIVSIDVKHDEHGNYQPYSHCGQQQQPISLEQHIVACEQAGAGEFMLQSISHDGMMEGFDIGLFQHAMTCTQAPIIGAAGSGNYQHLKDAFVETNISAIACGSLFNFSDSNPIRAKNYLTNYGLAFKQV